ncbi:hypothetical protein E8E13_011422 [Curvularia kusanoi]|uniref:Uncharacterized protein n=1 Tax=Curvularia kusanoi TaxID=90978 RepID=A0A9P4TQV3_CURKU|nr:hypothetical protein E8E13_011422 [Curvularia kusanoi]
MSALNAAAATFAPAPTQAQALASLLAFGPQRIAMTTERDNASASPDQPAFLRGVRFNPSNTTEWYEVVLPYVSECTVIIASTTDVTYAAAMFGSTALPDLYNAITKVELPGFYWFNGVDLNRQHNPYMQLLRRLPNLRELSFAMHPGGLTTQRWHEREMHEIEPTDPERAKERILRSPQQVINSYELDALFSCQSLHRLRLEYVESPIINHFCPSGNPEDILNNIKAYLQQGFATRSMQVTVE